MRVLLTNDDGINAPGLKALEEIACAVADEVWVVAPETDQSGSSHSLTLADPLRVREVGERKFAVRGTPTDCVIMALRQLVPHSVDLVLSGVNAGQNLADDVTYSGTVAGAMEGMTLGVRAFALSQAFGWDERPGPDYAPAVRHGPSVIRRLLAEDLPRQALVNINFPDCAPDEVKGVLLTVQGRTEQENLSVEARRDGRNVPYYWLAYRRRPHTPLDGTDLHAVENGYISVTPLQLDLTAHDVRSRLARNWRTDLD